MAKTILYFQGSRCEADQKKLAGLTHFVTSQGWRILILKAPRKREILHRLLDFWKPDGAVIGTRHESPELDGIPTVIMGTPPRNYEGKSHFVTHDSAATAALAAKELLSLGYQDYAFAGAINGEGWSSARQKCFERCLRLHEKGCRVFTPNRTDETDTIALQRHLRAWIGALPRPCALFAANDIIGRAVLDAAAAIGLRVPQDLAVCSVDNDEQICLSTTPTMTSIEPDYIRGGHLAGVLFKEIFDNPRRKVSRAPVLFGPVTVRRRGSTRILGRRDKTVNDALDYIRENFNRGIDVRDVAKLFPCSRRMAEIRFKKITGNTILAEILFARLEFAQSLLRRPGLSLEAVASLSGWKTYSVFRKYYLKATGQTPKDARRHAPRR